ncbi:MAG: OmpA family protein [Deltaproteobacteria bacterium]|nr:OmpA family protein [Deltaproteobacteria bacterium]
MRSLRTSSILALALVPGLSLAARADEGSPGIPHPGFYLGIYGGYDLVLGDWDLNEVSDAGVAPKSSLMGGVRLGLQPNAWLAIELGVAVIPFAADTTEDLSGVALGLRGDVLISPIDAAWSPHLLVGGGAFMLASGDLGSDSDWEMHYGLGLRGMLTDFMNLRVEARHVFNDSFSSGLASNVELQLGLDFWLWEDSVRPPPPDSDADGIPDNEDACPLQKGVETARGCPDQDRDGLSDSFDACPDRPGPQNQRGCPDTDGDGVADDLDQCFQVPGVVERQGCPPPPPDADGDGVLDADDFCPEDPGPVFAGGCPDRDGDGVVDASDKCPDQPGVAEEAGCLPKAILKKFSGSVKGINFETGSAKIKKSSFKLLDEAVALFKQYGNLRVEISGHTDDQGPDDMNLKLSQDRAEAVRAYLVEKGLDVARFGALGYGETRPVATNKTGAGRAQNRRIEFKIMGQN